MENELGNQTAPKSRFYLSFRKFEVKIYQFSLKANNLYR